MPTRGAACPAAPESPTRTPRRARPRPGPGSAGHKGPETRTRPGLLLLPGPTLAAPAPGRPGRGRTLTSVRARRRRRALLGAGPGGRGAVPRAAARALLSGRRPPRRLLGHCRRLPRRAGGPGAGPASAAPAPASAPGLAGSARYSRPPRMTPPLPLARGRLTRRAGAARPPAQAARAQCSERAACSAAAAAAARAAARGRRGRRALTRMRRPPPLRRAHLRAAALPSGPGGFRRLGASTPACLSRGEAGRRGAEAPRCSGGGPGPRGGPCSRARDSVCDLLSRAVPIGGLHLNLCTDKEAIAASKIKLGPYHVEQITGWEEMKVPSPRRGGSDSTSAEHKAAPDPGGAAQERPKSTWSWRTAGGTFVRPF